MPKKNWIPPTSHYPNVNNMGAKNLPGELVTGVIGSACGVIGALIGESLAKLLEKKCSR